ncbi:MAG: guanylate kinase [Betaproteobacteria bacterium]|nr:guanylate kinase [Betaproteobacteria bacterium]
MRGRLFVISAPSGAGKTSLVKALLAVEPSLNLSVSYTTRLPRPSELDGQDYHFVSPARFQELQSAGAFLECASVHGNFYATSHRWLDEKLAEGCDVLLEIDWQGAAQVRRLLSEAISLFILPPSLETLAQRLHGRRQDTPEVIAQRLAAARTEIEHYVEFDYVIINNDFQTALDDLRAILRASALRLSDQAQRQASLISNLLN